MGTPPPPRSPRRSPRSCPRRARRGCSMGSRRARRSASRRTSCSSGALREPHPPRVLPRPRRAGLVPTTETAQRLRTFGCARASHVIGVATRHTHATLLREIKSNPLASQVVRRGEGAPRRAHPPKGRPRPRPHLRREPRRRRDRGRREQPVHHPVRRRGSRASRGVASEERGKKKWNSPSAALRRPLAPRRVPRRARGHRAPHRGSARGRIAVARRGGIVRPRPRPRRELRRVRPTKRAFCRSSSSDSGSRAAAAQETRPHLGFVEAFVLGAAAKAFAIALATPVTRAAVIARAAERGRAARTVDSGTNVNTRREETRRRRPVDATRGGDDEDVGEGSGASGGLGEDGDGAPRGEGEDRSEEDASDPSDPSSASFSFAARVRLWSEAVSRATREGGVGSLWAGAGGARFARSAFAAAVMFAVRERLDAAVGGGGGG